MLPFSALQTITFVVTAITFAFSINYYLKTTSTTSNISLEPAQFMTTAAATTTKQALKAAMSTLPNAKITPRRSQARGHADHGWLNTYHTFSFAQYYDPQFQNFGSLRVLNEDRVAPGNGFPTHPHRDAEIFSYILSGELTHRDSMQKKGAESDNKNMFYRMKRGDVQFTTGGTGIAHSEANEHHRDTVHFLQIWALPWKKGLKPIYHTDTFPEGDKRKGFVNIITPLKAGPKATVDEETAAVPAKNGTIPVHADLVFSAGIIPPGSKFEYTIGSDAATSRLGRKTYVHLPMTKGGKAKVRIDGRETLSEGDGAFVTNVNAGDVLTVESVGSEEAEVVLLDSN